MWAVYETKSMQKYIDVSTLTTLASISNYLIEKDFCFKYCKVIEICFRNVVKHVCLMDKIPHFSGGIILYG